MKYVFYIFLVCVIVAVSILAALSWLLGTVFSESHGAGQPSNVPAQNDWQTVDVNTTAPAAARTLLAPTPYFAATQVAQSVEATVAAHSAQATQTADALIFLQRQSDIQATATKRAFDNAVISQQVQATVTHLATIPEREKTSAMHSQQLQTVGLVGVIVIGIIVVSGLLVQIKSNTHAVTVRLAIEHMAQAQALAAQETERFQAQSQADRQSAERAWAEAHLAEERAVESQPEMQIDETKSTKRMSKIQVLPSRRIELPQTETH